jgi:hypothetical protein
MAHLALDKQTALVICGRFRDITMVFFPEPANRMQRRKFRRDLIGWAFGEAIAAFVRSPLPE